MKLLGPLHAIALLTLCIFTPFPGHAQPVWQYVQLPVPLGGSSALFADTVDDALYVGGNYSLNDSNQWGDNALFRYQNGQWDTLPGLDEPVSCIIRYGDSLLVTGGTQTGIGDGINRIVRWDGAAWQPFGNFPVGGVQRMRILNGELYAVGTFPSADGHQCNGVAKRQGGSWVNVGLPEFAYDEIGVNDIALYQGQLVITGVMNAVGSTSRDIMAFDGQDWYKLCEPGLLGSIAGGGALIEYQGDLYVAGVILRSSGNVGQNIQRWDGAQWHDLDGGLTPEPGNTGFWGSGEQLLVHDGLLWVGGGFYYAGTTPAWSIATWNGHHWCGLGGELTPTSYAFTFFHDTLYATCSCPNPDGFVQDVARYIGTDYADTCGLNVSVSELSEGASPNVLSWIDQNDGTAWVQGLRRGPQPYAIIDMQGRVIVQGTLHSDGVWPVTIRMPSCSAGVYLFRADGRSVRFAVP